jgi:hypothetical protein
MGNDSPINIGIEDVLENVVTLIIETSMGSDAVIVYIIKYIDAWDRSG